MQWIHPSHLLTHTPPTHSRLHIPLPALPAYSTAFDPSPPAPDFARIPNSCLTLSPPTTLPTGDILTIHPELDTWDSLTKEPVSDRPSFKPSRIDSRRYTGTGKFTAALPGGTSSPSACHQPWDPSVNCKAQHVSARLRTRHQDTACNCIFA
jgi:hypothetical protein